MFWQWMFAEDITEIQGGKYGNSIRNCFHSHRHLIISYWDRGITTNTPRHTDTQL